MLASADTADANISLQSNTYLKSATQIHQFDVSHLADVQQLLIAKQASLHQSDCDCL